MLVMLAMTVTPNTDKSSGIYERALRSIDETAGRDQRDRRARKARMARVTASMIRGPNIPTEGIYPGLGDRWGIPADERVALVIPAGHIRKFCEKIVRGIYYIESGDFIAPPFEIDFYALDDAGAEPVKEMLDAHGKKYVRGPGFEVVRVAPVDEQMASIFQITIFGEFRMYAVVSEPD